MCLSTVFIKSGDQQEKVMQNVTRMECKNGSYLLTGLLGDQKFVKGKIKKINFVDDHSVILERDD